MIKFLISISLFLSSVSKASELIVWNVGQGQWVSEVHSRFCIHYDLGGEINPSSRARQACGNKMNLLHLSHWDWDHISFASSFAKSVRSACLVKWPEGAPSEYKMKKLKTISLCPPESLRLWESSEKTLFHTQKASHSNDLSEVVFSKDFQTLIPGDSPKTQEKKWAASTPSSGRGLILGHHGSRTSTSSYLLDQLPDLKWAVASARVNRYGHPHLEVRERLKLRKIPLLKTEDWGHLHFQKNSD